MSTIQRSSGLTKLVILTAVGLVPVGLSCVYTRCAGPRLRRRTRPRRAGHAQPWAIPGDFENMRRRGLRKGDEEEEPARGKGRRIG